ncbi:alpha-2-macroglobulin isoform 1-T1 [Menidia menidia]
MAPVRALIAVTMVAVLLGSATSAGLNDTIYAVTVSSHVTGGNQETLCAQVRSPSEDMTLVIGLSVDSTDQVILEQPLKDDFYRCVQFQVPTVRSSTVATVQAAIRVGSEEKNRISKKTKIMIKPPAFIHVVQTDKPIYKPGQTVQFRIVSMDTSFIPVDRVYKEVALQDPNSNRIAQWLKKAIVGGILDLSHPIIPEAPQGTYTITALTDKEEQISHTFEIKEYVLPKYEVKVQLPDVITILDKEVTVRICAKYTYGKPVLGSAKATFCRIATASFWYIRQGEETKCRTFELKTDKSGCATQNVVMEEFISKINMHVHSFEVTAEVEEYGTGVTLSGSGRASYSNQIRTLTFEDTPAAYKPGIPFEGKVKMVGADNRPVANEAVYLSVGVSAPILLTTDLKGIAPFSLDTSAWKNSANLMANSRNSTNVRPSGVSELRVEYGVAYHYVKEFYSKSRSFLKLMQVGESLSCNKDASLRAQYIIQGEELKEGQAVLDFFYLVLSKGAIVQHGRVPVAVKAGTVNKGELTVPLGQVMDLAPVAQVVVYTVMPGGEAVADSQDFPIQLCLKNKVSLKFSSVQELPAGQTTLNLQAQPSSLCSVRAIDQSVLLLQAEEELTVDYVYRQLPIQKLSGYFYEVEDPEPHPCFPRPLPWPGIPEPELELAPEPELEPEPEPVVEVRLEPEPTKAPDTDSPLPGRQKRSLYFGPSRERDDVYSVFENIGVKLLTNSDVRRPSDCSYFRRDLVLSEADGDVESLVPMAVNMMPQSPGGMMRGKEEEKKETIRTFFPETWIWDLVTVGANGSVDMKKTVPDTITKWAAGAFCVSSVGFGVSPNIGLTAFQPFFVSLTLPYSVIRGEVFTLKATVFNYQSKCIMVKVTLATSDQYTFRNCHDCQYTVCVCGEESRTFSWIVTPTALGTLSVKVSAEALKTTELCGNDVVTVPDVGQIDTVIRTLLVEPEGTPQMVSHNALLCPAEGPLEKKISLLLPEIFVAGSARASVSVLGDLMGRAMQNIDKLLAMPYGCGEQNMVLFAPNIFILNYLNSTGQLTQRILDKATRFLESGYQRELTYKHDDGSYSAFGNQDESGNTWLTAFVMKSFGGARPYIYVDVQHINDAWMWLSKYQRADGCISSVGKLFHNGMKGGVSDDVSLTAYIAAAKLELDGDATDPVVQNCLRCLKQSGVAQMDNLYTTSLLFYTFSLAGDEEMRSKLITFLNQKSITEGGTRHWKRQGASDKGLDSLEVEMTSYVLLGLLHQPSLEGFGLDYSVGIVRWLTQQQNPYGGFSSTQDTVVALQALAKYGAATYSPEGSTAVTVTSLGGLNVQFTVNQDNRLLYQEKKLTEIPGEYTIKAEGQSCVMAQISMHVNIPPPADFSAFNVSTSTMAKCADKPPQLILFVHVRYQGRRTETNMVIVNIKLLSGHILDKSSLKLLQSDKSVKRVDVDEGYINIYLDELKKGETRIYSVTLEEDQQVRNLKPAVVKVYDYYQTSDEAVTDYTSPCAESDATNTV